MPIRHQPLGRGAGLVGDGLAGKHAGNLLAPALAVEHEHACRHGLAFGPVHGLLGDQDMLIGERRDLRRMGHGEDLHLAPSRARRSPTAAAVAPPTPASTSSKTSVGAEPRAASTTFSASMKRASSPPDATFIKGPGSVPGLVRTKKATRSMPCGPPSCRLTVSILVIELRLVELERRKLGHDLVIEPLGRASLRASLKDVAALA